MEELSKLRVSDDINVFWIDDMMYVNDESDGQAIITIDLYSAYKFALLINASHFDYDTNDDVVKRFSEELLENVDEDFYNINVWEYLDDIADDFMTLSNIEINSINNKRHIVSSMSEMNDGYDLLCGFGSATYIAKLLWDYIKGNEKKHIPKSNNKIINELADEYLLSDKYDLRKFAEELHKKVGEEKEPLTLKKLMQSLMQEKFYDNDNPKLYIELEENIEAVTEETPYGNIYQISGYRLDDDEDIYLSIK